MGYLGALAGAKIGSVVGGRMAEKIGAQAGKMASGAMTAGHGVSGAVESLSQPPVPYAPGKVNVMSGQAREFFDGHHDSVVDAATRLGTTYAPQIGAVIGMHALGMAGRAGHNAASRVSNFATGASGNNDQQYGNVY